MRILIQDMKLELQNLERDKKVEKLIKKLKIKRLINLIESLIKSFINEMD